VTGDPLELSPFKTKIQEHFDAIAPESRSWRDRNAYYYEAQTTYFRFLIPPGKRVLELGCGTGELLSALEPAYGVGVDLSSHMVRLAQDRFPALVFHQADAENPATWGIEGSFDYIVMADLAGYLEDVQATFGNLRPFCDRSTRIVISHYNLLWEPVFKLSEYLGLKKPSGTGSWLSPEDLDNFLYLEDFEAIKRERRLLIPKKIPLLHPVFDFLASLPLVNRLCISNYVVARPRDRIQAASDRSVSVIIPCKNERENIEPAVKGIPEIGSHTEIVFVDGHSADGTQDEIGRVMKSFPEKDIKFLVQDGQGKGDAVRKGFAHATGDILMILDADLTVPPEELPKFYDAIATDKGEFISGSRLVYAMEDQAMRLLNILGNKFFSLVFTWLLNQRIKDTLCGTKVISRENYEQLSANRAYFGDFDPFGDFDLLFGASKLNLKMIEIPIRYRARRYGETQISRFRHGFLLLRMCLYATRKLKLV